MNELRGCCGLDCEKCEARIATVNNDDALRKDVADRWSKMNNSPAITPETINCMGCRAESECKFYFCSHLCETRKCCQSRGFATCAECGEWSECPKIKPFLDHEDVRAFLSGR